MMTFLLFAPSSTKWLGWRKDRKSRRDRSGRFCDIYLVHSYFDTLLRYAVTFGAAVILKFMDQKTLVKRRWGYKVRLTTLGEFARHEFTNLWFILETLPDTLSALFDRNKTQPQTSKTGEQRLAYHYQNDGRLQKFADHQILCWLIPCSQMSFRFKV